MAESTLSIQYSDLREEIAFYLGYGRTSANWSTDQTSTITSVLKSGLRQFYHPPRLPNDATTHQWNFMFPVTTLTTGSTTGTSSGTPSGTTLTATSAVFESRMANPDGDFSTNVTFTTSGNVYTISSYTSTTVVELDSDASGETDGDTFTIGSQRDYDLPDNFGAIHGEITFSSSSNYASIPQIGEGQIRDLRRGATITSFPTHCAIRPKATDGTIGQRFEIMFYPAPDSQYVLSYAYTPLTDVLSDSVPYPYGGEIHGETILCSCLAVAEQRLDDQKGVKWQDFMQKLQTSVDLDRKNWTPETLGYNHNNAEGFVTDYRNTKIVTVDGVRPS